ncbi:hypothetical protein M0802_012548 [Mischocyttarus mexicanus]|nr:hypothetical protein M0802_012548 [Mischocyttarus mexicanus]
MTEWWIDLCRYFKNGSCRKGNKCKYRHAESSLQPESSYQIESFHKIEPTLRQSTCKKPQVLFVFSCNITCRLIKTSTCKKGSVCPFSRNSNRDDDSWSQNDLEESSSLSQRNSDILNSTEISFNLEPIKLRMKELMTFSNNSQIPGSSKSNDKIITVSYRLPSKSKPLVYAQAGNPEVTNYHRSWEPLCPVSGAKGICLHPGCQYLHGILCEFCGKGALHPFNKNRQIKHINKCIKKYAIKPIEITEHATESSETIKNASKPKEEIICCICFEEVIEKDPSERKFGILPNCDHSYCFECIHKWRNARQKTYRTTECPACRTNSDFIYPSLSWVNNKEEKAKFIKDYKSDAKEKNCRYFKKGYGACPYGINCIYLHADLSKKICRPY